LSNEGGMASGMIAALLLVMPSLVGAFMLSASHIPLHHTRLNHCQAQASADEPWEELDVLHTPLSDPLPNRKAADQISQDDRAWVLVFNEGTSEESTYMLVDMLSPSSPDLLIAFEQADEALRFADQLQAEGCDLAKPVERTADELRAFCKHREFEINVVPAGTLALPPSINEFDDDASTRKRPETHAVNPMTAAASALQQMRRHIETYFDI